MHQNLIISGFGGQGALFAGQVLAYAGMDAGCHVTWIPSYGPEMRGGTAHVTVTLSDEEIGSPVVERPQAVIALNNPSLEKYEPLVKPGGLLIYNSAIITHSPSRPDIRVIAVPASTIASELGNIKMANMVTLGAFVQATQVLPLPVLAQALADHLPANKQKWLTANQTALQQGADLALTAMEVA